MYLGYNTNGLAHHDPQQAIDLLAKLGYQGVAITVDHQWLNPFGRDFDHQLETIRQHLNQHQLRNVVETGARYLLDSNVKHEPTLLSQGLENRQRRIDYLKSCIDIAVELNSDCVSLWSGRQPHQIDASTAMDRLTESLAPVIRYAEQNKVTIGFEPEPGMFIDTMAAYQHLLQRIESPNFQLTLDVGHLFCQGELPLVDFVSHWRDRIVNVHIEDMNPGVHEHLMFGEGQINFAPLLEMFRKIEYAGGVYVELSRHSHDAPNVAARSFEFLNALLSRQS